jgi:hypothetical protein
MRIEQIELPSANLVCARYGNGRVRCGGNNFLGQLGIGERASDTTLYAAVEAHGITDARGLAAGVAHVCVLHAAGAVSCWGMGSSGELGNGELTANPSAQSVAGLDDAIEVVAGNSHTCAIKKAGGVVCWGYNDAGQAGDGTSVNRSKPVTVPGITDAAHLALGFRASCASKRDGRVTCWGTLGGAKGAPKIVDGVSAVKQITLTQNGGACVLSHGAVSCWGAGFDARPRAVAGVGEVAAMDGGNSHVCARSPSGHVTCWEGASEPHAFATAAGPVTSARLLTAGSGFTCVVTDDDAVLCPGDNPLQAVAAAL